MRRKSKGYTLVEALMCALLAAVLAALATAVVRDAVMIVAVADSSLARASDILSIRSELDAGASGEIDSYLAKWNGTVSESGAAGKKRFSVELIGPNGMPFAFSWDSPAVAGK